MAPQVLFYDLYPLENIESRKRYYAQAMPEKWLTMFTHDAKLPWAYVAKDEKGKIVVGEWEMVVQTGAYLPEELRGSV